MGSLLGSQLCGLRLPQPPPHSDDGENMNIHGELHRTPRHLQCKPPPVRTMHSSTNNFTLPTDLQLEPFRRHATIGAATSLPKTTIFLTALLPELRTPTSRSSVHRARPLHRPTGAGK
ncbi:hypothetical protein MA16_Dca022571 [Dendrobium catenatum]|uniref:Uncharacterized protein n=1 Tax=Dendrobium catenatum TaxID=906689 RepID=A0A2I0X2X5_9ASPA|nr:hypothetical protein MA16_Dca022571 [Dendrobium catenatum]